MGVVIALPKMVITTRPIIASASGAAYRHTRRSGPDLRSFINIEVADSGQSNAFLPSQAEDGCINCCTTSIKCCL